MLRNQLENAPTASPDAVPSLRVDMITYLSKTTLDIISFTGFNYDFDTLHQKPGEAGTELADALHRFLSPEKFPVFFFLKSFIPLLRLWEWDARAHDAREARVSLRKIGESLIESGIKRAREEKASGGGTDLKHTGMHSSASCCIESADAWSRRARQGPALSHDQIKHVDHGSTRTASFV